MRPLSLAWRVRLLVTAVVATVAVATGAASYTRFRDAWIDHVDRLLAIMVEGASVTAGNWEDEARQRRNLERIVDTPWRGPGTEFHVWFDARPRAGIASSGAERLFRNLPVQPEGGKPAYFDLRQVRKRFRAVWLREARGNDTLNVLIAHPTGFEHRRLRELLGSLLLGGAITVFLAATIGAQAVLWALRPLRTMSAGIAKVREEDPDAGELRQLRVPSELQPVIDEVASLVDRLGTALEQQRRLVADASHQLRSPLTVARSTLELARDERADSARLRTALDEALCDLERLQSLMDRLLTLARLERESSAIEHVELRLDALLDERAAYWSRIAEQNGGRVFLETSTPSRVRGDEQLLELLFDTLLENAIAHGPVGGTVRMRVRTESELLCVAEVEDQGGSIPPGMLDRIFDRFARSPEARDRHPGGTGLGLAIAREIAVLHGGSIRASTVPGTSTLFQVRLPSERPTRDLS